MNLKDFIENTLVEISDGIEAANERLNKHDKRLFAKYVMGNSSDDNEQSKICFDVAVTSSKNGSAKTKGKFNIFVVDAEIGGEAAISNQNVSRVKFEVSTNQTVGYVAKK